MVGRMLLISTLGMKGCLEGAEKQVANAEKSEREAQSLIFLRLEGWVAGE